MLFFIIMDCLNRFFLEHPRINGENYIEHFTEAITISYKFFAFSINELIHAIVPGVDIFHICNTTSINELEKILKELKERNNIREKDE
jgi:hypothetical protein